MDYGNDFKLDADGDIIFTEDGDIATLDGPALILQDIREELGIPLGALQWDPAAGSVMVSFLNDAGVTEADILDELERVALADPRIDAASIQAEKITAGKYRVTFRPLGQQTGISLDYGDNNG